MKLSTAAKRVCISLGVYKPARRLHRFLHREDARLFRQHIHLLRAFISPGDLAFDVGANIGIKSEMFLSLGARVVAFEPQPECARELRTHNNLTVVETAIGDAAGRATLHLNDAITHASLLPNWECKSELDSIEVPVITLDQAVERYGKPKFCKIDIEGYEPQALRGLTYPIEAMSIEYHLDEGGKERTALCLRILSQLANYRYNLTDGKEADFLLPDFVDVSSIDFSRSKNGWGDIFLTRSQTT